MTLHKDMTNHPTDSVLKDLHLPGYSVADSAARVAITTMQAGDLCYQQDEQAYYLYDGSNWKPISSVSITLSDGQIAFGDSSGNIIGSAALKWDTAAERIIVEGSAIGLDGKAEVGEGFGYFYLYGLQPFLQGFRANGSQGSESAVQSGDLLFRISAAGYGATGWSGARARLNFVALEDWTDTDQGAGGALQGTPLGSTTPVDVFSWDGESITAEKFFSLGSPVQVTIAAGEITVSRSYHTVATEGGASTDDLESINGGHDGHILVLRADGNEVVVKHGIGNIMLDGQMDVTLDNDADTVMLMYDDGSGMWLELSHSDNDIAP